MKKILVADDSHEFVSMYSSLLSEMGFVPITASNGAEAVQLAWKERPDLIILDLEMPMMTGAECTRILRQDSSCAVIPVVIITSHISERDMDACYQGGVNEILSKPFSEQQLINLFNRYVSSD